MEVIKETLWKRCLSTPTKPPSKNNNICLSETAYQHKRTRKTCKKTNQVAIIQWQRQCLTYKPDRKPWPKSKTSDILSIVPVHCITPFCSDALVSPPNLYPPWLFHFKHATFEGLKTKTIPNNFFLSIWIFIYFIYLFILFFYIFHRHFSRLCWCVGKWRIACVSFPSFRGDHF